MDGFEVIGLSMELLVSGGIAIGFLVLSATLFATGVLIDRSIYRDGDWAYMAGFFMAILGVVVTLVTVIFLVPFNALYHHWYSTTGTVTSVTNMFESGSGEITSGYVVELDTVDRPLVFDDARVIRAEGSEIEVACSVEWVPAGADRLNCWIAS